VSDTLRGVLSHLVSLVPGYTGYADLEKRRESDHALRLAIATRLVTIRSAVDRRIAECSRRQRFDGLEALDGLGRRVSRLADRVRHAPAGYTGLFDSVQVDAAALDRLYERDLAVREACERLATAVDGLAAPADGAPDGAAAEMAAAETAVASRDQALAEVR